MRYSSTLLVLLACAIGCQGPISDWPKSSSDDGPTGGLSGTPAAPPSVTPGAAAGGIAGGGGTSAPSQTPTPTTPGSAAGGAAAGSSAGGLLAGTGIGGGGLTGGGGATVADAGASAGAPGDAGIASDASVAQPDASFDGGVPPLGSDAAIDAGNPSDAGDGGCAQPASDAGLCPSFGCRTREQLRAAASPQGACSAEQAIALACDGRVGKAALECTQESVFSISLERSINMCLKRDAAIAQLSSGCLACYVDEALCTLSRCFAACTLTEGGDCKVCRQQQCGAAFARCSGLPMPMF